MSFRSVLFVVCALWGLSFPASFASDQASLAQPVVDEIDGIIEAVLAEQKSPGCSVSVVWNGEMRLAKGYGVVNVETEEPATAKTVYRLASISKMITATAAMKLVEAGKLELDTPVQAYCPAYPEKEYEVTLHHLLAHQGGIRHWLFSSERLNQKHYPTVEASLAVIEKSGLMFEPGTDESYSTPGYNVVGCAVEGASGLDYAEYMAQHIFKPAGMDTALVGDAPADYPLRSRAYRMERDEVVDARPDDLSIKYPGGGLSGSVLDLARFVEALYGSELVSPETLETMWTQKTLQDGTETDKGYGCNIGEEKDRRVVWHVGGVSGFSGVLYCYPEKQAAVALLFNMEAQPVFPTASAVMDAAIAGAGE